MRSCQSAIATHSLHIDRGTAEDLDQLFALWQEQRDPGAREALVKRFMPLTRSLARRYDRSSEPFDDLLQVASVGLLKALDRFDPQRGHSFPSFAVPTILGEMRRYFRDCGWSVHVPRGDQERALKVRDAQETLTNEHGHAPTVSQLSQYLELETEQVIDALQATQAYESLSLDAPRPGGEDDTITFGDGMGSEDERYELVELDAHDRRRDPTHPGTGASDAAHALRRGSHPNGDCRPPENLANAGLAPAAPLA